MPDIWLPKAETKATVLDGVVKVWDEMKFVPKPVASPTGFVKKEEADGPA